MSEQNQDDQDTELAERTWKTFTLWMKWGIIISALILLILGLAFTDFP